MKLALALLFGSPRFQRVAGVTLALMSLGAFLTLALT
jgi:hypothetical protein